MNRLLFNTIKNGFDTSGLRQYLINDVDCKSNYSRIHAALEMASETDSCFFYEPEFQKITLFNNIDLNNPYFNKYTNHSFIYYMLSSHINYIVSLTYWLDKVIYGHIDQYARAFYFQTNTNRLCISIKISSYSVVIFFVHFKISQTSCIIFEYFKFMLKGVKSRTEIIFYALFNSYDLMTERMQSIPINLILSRHQR